MERATGGGRGECKRTFGKCGEKMNMGMGQPSMKGRSGPVGNKDEGTRGQWAANRSESPP